MNHIGEDGKTCWYVPNPTEAGEELKTRIGALAYIEISPMQYFNVNEAAMVIIRIASRLEAPEKN